MPLVVADRVRETTTTTGTGTITLAGAVTGYQSFSAIGNGNTTYYTINAGSQWEVGIGTYSGTGPTLSRDTVLESSNSGSLVDFAAGTKDVFVTYPAEKSISDGYGLLPIANGGTGATTAPNALTALGAYPASNPSGFTSNTGTVTSVDLTAGTGISVSGGPVTSSGAITVTNTAPDQVVSLTGAGTTVITGTYPNFTVTSNDSTTGTVTSVGGTGTVNGITLTGTVTTSGNLTLGGTLSGVNLTSQVTGTLPIANGGTNATTAADALTSLGAYPASNPSGYTSNTGTVTSVGGTGTVNGITLTGSVTASGNLTLGGTLSGVDLTSQVTGTLPVANGGTGATSLTSGYLVKGNGTSAVSASLVYDTGTNVGIGTSSPATRLDVNGSITVRTAAGFDTSFTNPLGSGGVAMVSTTDPTAADQRLFALAFGSATYSSQVRIEAVASEAWTASNRGAYLRFNTTATGTTGQTEKMRIDSSGQVGIGTASPSAKLHVFGDTFFVNTVAGRGFQLKTIASSNGRSDNSVQYSAGDASSAEHIWGYGGAASFTERMRIDSSGNVGIGTSSPSSLGTLVVSKASSGTPIIALESLGSWNASISVNSSGNLIFSNNAATERMRIDADGDVGIGNSDPGYRLDISAADTTSGLGYGMRLRGNATANGGSMQFTDSAVTAQWAIITANTSEFRLTADGRPMTFYTNGVERARIDSSGNVGIGTSSPSYKLSVSGTAEITAAKEGVFAITDGTVSLDPNNGSIQTWTLGANRTPDRKQTGRRGSPSRS
jgi:trimeric autotransporter adhesin